MHLLVVVEPQQQSEAASFAVIQLPKNAPIPSWVLANASSSAFLSITYTTDELSLVIEERFVKHLEADSKENAAAADYNKHVKVEGGWRCLKVDEGVLDFSLVGVLSSIAEPLAKAGVSIFTVSTFNTDYILVKNKQLHAAIRVLQEQGHTITHPPSAASS